jgi:hypothetical protein
VQKCVDEYKLRERVQRATGYIRPEWATWQHKGKTAWWWLIG